MKHQPSSFHGKEAHFTGATWRHHRVGYSFTYLAIKQPAWHHLHGNIDLELFATLNGRKEEWEPLYLATFVLCIATYSSRIIVTGGERCIHISIIATQNTRIQKYSWPTDTHHNLWEISQKCSTLPTLEIDSGQVMKEKKGLIFVFSLRRVCGSGSEGVQYEYGELGKVLYLATAAEWNSLLSFIWPAFIVCCALFLWQNVENQL